MIYAIIEDGIVINKIVADDKFIKANKLNAVKVDELNVEIGATYVDGEFTNPAPIIGKKFWELDDSETL